MPEGQPEGEAFITAAGVRCYKPPGIDPVTSQKMCADREAARPVPQGEPWMVARYHAEVPTDRTDDTCVLTVIAANVDRLR